MKTFLRSFTRLSGCLALVTCSMTTASAQQAAGVGDAWSRIIRHFDGTQTRSVKEGDKNEIKEEKFDENNVLVAKRLFRLDSKGRLRNGIIMDAKDKVLGSTAYGYDQYDRINEERLYNAQGVPIQRKFPPGTLPNIPQNARHSIIFILDPKNPNGPGTMQQSDEPLIQPVNKAEDNFTPGLPGGNRPQSSGASNGLPLDNTPVPSASGRRPSLLKQKPSR
jgi:hypothetical protein